MNESAQPEEPLGEFALIAQLAPFLADGGPEGAVRVGHGDDAAVLVVGDRLVCLAVDVVVEGVHFRRDVSAPSDVGWKAVAVNCSDLAAMGASPTAAVVGLCRPADVPADEIAQLYAGMSDACGQWGLRLVGGDTVAAEALALSVTVLGEVPSGKIVRRSGARPGDALVVVGGLGAAAAALAGLQAGTDVAPALLQAHRRPRALVRAGEVLAAAGATAMIDISDGLGADLGHLCTASGVGARVRAGDLPVSAGVTEAALAAGVDPLQLVCGGGEDFALLAAVPADQAAAIAAEAGAADGVPAAVVGLITEPGTGPAAVLEQPDGTTTDLQSLGYEHYTREGREGG